jgi:GT2 family glycosyltransferase
MLKNILVTVTNQHWIHKHVVHKMLKLLLDGRYKVSIQMPSHKPYENNLNHIVVNFFYTKYDFWLNMDSDNPPLKNPLDLIELDKDIIGLPTPIWHYTRGGKRERPIYWNAYDYDSDADAYREHANKNGLQRVDAVGTGCMLVNKRVFDNVEMRKAPFLRTWNKDGTMNKGNDISFCERARKEGFEIYCHFGYPCDHFSELSLQETVNAFRYFYEG